MKFWKLLGTFGCLCLLLVIVLAYWLQDPAGGADHSAPNQPHAAPRIPTSN